MFLVDTAHGLSHKCKHSPVLTEPYGFLWDKLYYRKIYVGNYKFNTRGIPIDIRRINQMFWIILILQIYIRKEWRSKRTLESCENSSYQSSTYWLIDILIFLVHPIFSQILQISSDNSNSKRNWSFISNLCKSIFNNQINWNATDYEFVMVEARCDTTEYSRWFLKFTPFWEDSRGYLINLRM